MLDPNSTVSRALPWTSGDYSTKRHGEYISNCEHEPVETPGCIQNHGVLLVLGVPDLMVTQVSDNVGDVLGLTPEALFGTPISALLGIEAESFIHLLLAEDSLDANPRYVCSFERSSGEAPLDATAHLMDGLVIVELEPTDRSKLRPELEFYTLAKKMLKRLEQAQSLQQFCQIITREIRDITGLDRVMVYQFHRDDHGEVIAESKRDDLVSWMNLHFPAHDIPSQVRELLTRVWIRPVPDVAGGLAEMRPLKNPITGKPLNMSQCALRGASLTYIEYLQNLGVKAALTLPIKRDKALWGLVAAHHTSGPKFIGYQLRAVVEFLAQLASLENKAAEKREHLEYSMHIDGVHLQLISATTNQTELGAITQGSPSLIDGISATGAAMFYRDRWWCVGCTPTESQLHSLVDWLAARAGFNKPIDPLYATDSIVEDFPEAEEFADVASGVLAVPLFQDLRDVVFWFRPESVRTRIWAGDPSDRPTVMGPSGPRPTPRRNFEPFIEEIRRRATPWTSTEVQAAISFRQLLMQLVASRAEGSVTRALAKG